jgi:hypothetical protein
VDFPFTCDVTSVFVLWSTVLPVNQLLHFKLFFTQILAILHLHFSFVYSTLSIHTPPPPPTRTPTLDPTRRPLSCIESSSLVAQNLGLQLDCYNNRPKDIMSNNKNHKKRSADFASLLSQHTKVKRQRKQPRKKSKSTEPVNAILATLRRVCATGELLTPTPLPGLESSSSSSSSSEATLVAPTTAPKNVCARDQQTLALCFLCVEALPHRKVWQEWVRQAKETFGKGGHGLRIFIHAKFPERLDPWSQQYLIRDDRGEIINFKPDWGKIEVTRALMKLFETALTFPDVGRMTYVSESCIPIVTFDQAWYRRRMMMD